MAILHQSRSKWPLLLINESPACHGEKFTDQTPILDLIKVEDQKEENSALLANCLQLPVETSFRIQNTEDPTVIALSQIKSTTSSQHIWDREAVIKMEEFVDLSGYCPPDKSDTKYLNAVDELNTPIFEMRNPFDFGQYSSHINNNNTDILQQQHIDHNYIINIKSEPDTVNNDIFSHYDVNLMKHTDEEESVDIIKNSLVIINNNNNNNQSEETVMWSPNSLNMICNNSNSRTPVTMATILDDDDENLATVNSFNDILNIKMHDLAPITNNQFLELKNLAYETPDESTCSSSLSSKSNHKLKLDIEAANSKIVEESIKTSDVLNTIDEIETAKGFNILQYIENEALQIATTTELKNIETNATIDMNESFYNTNEESKSSKILTNNSNTNTRILGKRPRKRSESDEEYFPPSEKRVVAKRRKYSSHVYDDDDDESEESMKVIKRGRPPKRNVSISSDDYGETPEARYRELRDKNNEASRRSRLKRKVKEQQYEQEADELEEKNRKLRVQVEELQKTVNSFRNDLMKLLLSKKS